MRFYILSFVLLIMVIAIDQVSKFYIQSLKIVGIIKVFHWLNLVSVWNRGVTFGLFSNMYYSNLFFIILNILISIILLYIMLKSKNKAIGSAMILGGAIGNIVDRIRFGAVYDFIDVNFYGWHWPAFNVADSMIFIGVVVFYIGDSYVRKIDKNV